MFICLMSCLLMFREIQRNVLSYGNCCRPCHMLDMNYVCEYMSKTYILLSFLVLQIARSLFGFLELRLHYNHLTVKFLVEQIQHVIWLVQLFDKFLLLCPALNLFILKDVLVTFYRAMIIMSSMILLDGLIRNESLTSSPQQF